MSCGMLVPCIRGGNSATTMDAAKALQQGASKDWTRALSDIDEAHAKLSGRADRVAVLAWSMGVWFSWQLAQARADRVNGLVSYHRLGEVQPGTALPPILGHFAEDDEFEALADVRGTAKKLVDAGASALAWDRTRAFLDRHLRR